MFDIEKAREKGLDERTVAILEKINENSEREKSCVGHVDTQELRHEQG